MTKSKLDMDPMISSLDSNEYFNSISHLIGAILSLAALTILVVFASLEQGALHIISFSIYGTTLLLSFLFSTLLHFFLLFNKYKVVLGILDHCAIYLLIAGTYTPICLIILGGWVGWLLFGITWGMAIFYITIKSIFFKKMSEVLSNLTYLSMGWLALFFIHTLYQKLPLTALILMLTGGLFFTVGAIIFQKGRPNPFPPYFGNHEIWHLFVLLGNLSFFVVMFYFVLPYNLK